MIKKKEIVKRENDGEESEWEEDSKDIKKQKWKARWMEVGRKEKVNKIRSKKEDWKRFKKKSEYWERRYGE